MNLQVVADGRHSVPTPIELQVDGAVRRARRSRRSPIAPSENATRHGAAALPGDDRAPDPRHDHRRAHAARDARVDRRHGRRAGRDRRARDPRACGSAPLPAELPGACRSDLLTIDGKPVPGARHGLAAAARRSSAGSPVDAVRSRAIRVACRRSRSTRGAHVLRTSEGVRTGVQLDRLVLASDAERRAARGRRRSRHRARHHAAGRAHGHVVHNGADAHARARDRRRRAVLARARAVAEHGWKATIANGGDARPVAARRRLRQRLARAARRSASFDVVLEWTPQRRVWAAIWISAIAALGVPRDRRLGVRCGAGGASPRRARSGRRRRVGLEWPVAPRGTPPSAPRPRRRSRCSPGSSRR